MSDLETFEALIKIAKANRLSHFSCHEMSGTFSPGAFSQPMTVDPKEPRQEPLPEFGLGSIDDPFSDESLEATFRQISEELKTDLGG